VRAGAIFSAPQTFEGGNEKSRRGILGMSAMTSTLNPAVPTPAVSALGATAVASRCYVGERSRAGCRVAVVDDGTAYPLRTRTHDPLWSFSWGRSGASARELAWSILYDSAHDVALADDWCASFTAEVISLLPREAFRLESQEVLEWLYEDRPHSWSANAAGTEAAM
jgi:hypothetical protein